jgi:hypothetical protein
MKSEKAPLSAPLHGSATAMRLMSEAQLRTGLSDFGPPTFHEGLERFLGCIQRQGLLSEAMVSPLVDLALKRLTNRLEIEETIRLNPQISALPIEGLLSITGLPRTGTTALVHMLSLDDAFRTPREWEQAQPCPPPLLGQELKDPRRLAAVERIKRLGRENPEQLALHLYDADATEEDLELLGLEFKTQQLAVPAFEYHIWWRDTDLSSAFAYHKRVLQLLQWRRPPNRWLLKSPAHTFHFEALVANYPNARFIMTHRDPAKAIPSVLSLLTSLLPAEMRTEAYLKTFALHHAEHLRIGIERAMAARARIGEARFFDIHHRDFSRDPFGTIARVYDFAGFELRPQVRKAMALWHARNRSGAHGLHRYAADQYGLSADQIRTDYAAYIRHFDVRPED